MSPQHDFEGLRYRRPSQNDDDDAIEAAERADMMPETSRGSTHPIITDSDMTMSPVDASPTAFSAAVDYNAASTQRRENARIEPMALPTYTAASGSHIDAPPSHFLSSHSDNDNDTVSGDSQTERRPSILKKQNALPPPRTRDRGYSLRRVLFARGTGGQDTPDSIELGAPGPSNGTRNISSSHSNGSPSKSSKSATVTVDGVVDDTDDELPPRPSSRKQNLYRSAISLPNYDRWIRKSKEAGPVGKLIQKYNAIRKRIKEVGQLPPSKDGRHIELDCRRQHKLIDERSGKEYISNLITSSKYTAWNFLPKQLFYQFSKVANTYFLLISILQMIPGLSTTGTYTTIVPLLVFICISMAKEGYDDFRRHKLDKAENNQSARVLSAKEEASYGVNYEEDAWVEKKWMDLKVGDVIQLKRDEGVPADMVILHSDGPNGVAFIETMALDGETNLKAKQASPGLAKQCKDVAGLLSAKAHVVVEDPNLDLYNFDGHVTINSETLPLTTNEIVLRGSILRNTGEVFGMVINSGEECKIRMNANKNPRIKFPSLQFVANKVVIIVVIFVLCLASLMTILYQVWYEHYQVHAWYLQKAKVGAGTILVSFIIMFNTMIPLSLYVSLEIIKLGQLFLMQDVEMYDPVSDTPMESRTTTINEELGQVSYIFSDKTGTLTDNVMRFRKMSVAGAAWLHDYDLQEEAEAAGQAQALANARIKGKGALMRVASHFSADYSMSEVPKASGLSRRSSVAWKSTARPAKGQPELRTEDMLQYLQHHPHGVFARKARFFLLSLALCHTCLPEKKQDGRIDFQAASPDELALVRAAQELGYLVIDRAAQTITLKSHPDGPESPEIVETYEVLDVIEFTSKRKRMSIIVRFPDGRRCIFCKGADSIVMKRLKHAPVAKQKVAEVERRASIRKSLEVESALRKMHEAGERPRGSLQLERTSFSLHHKSRSSGVARSLSVDHSNGPAREKISTWLTEREHDVDLTDVDNPQAYASPTTVKNIERRRSLAPTSPIEVPHEGRRSTGSFDRYGPMSPLEPDDYAGMVDEAVAMNESAVFERCFQHIDDFATEGLRTLLYGYKFLDEQEYQGWKKIYSDATTSLVNRQELIDAAGEQIEKDFELAGATAIEDKLQKGVPETIDKLRRANIRLWMLTGDKRETAINIGHSCRLIKDYSTTIILDHEQEKVDRVMAKALLDLQGGGIPHSVVVVDGATLSVIESDLTLASLFFDLTVCADSVICCRASPSQKASLVKSVREKISGSVTLAIGDGANDIAMIQEAHVGIGITGKEGLQAARTSDYAIAQFRFLSKLLLVHGRWNYIRTAKYILGTFWKEMLFYLTQACYQRYTGYTGTSLYESWSQSMFNTLFTSLPVIFLGIFDQDLNASTLLAVPELYTYGQKAKAFGIKKYLWWMFMAAGEALLTFFLILGLYGVSDTTDRGIYAVGDLAFSIIIIIVNTKLLFIEMHTKTFMCLVGWFASVGGWTAWNLLLSGIYGQKNSNAYSVRGGFLKHFGRNPTWWLVLIITVLFMVVFELGIMSIRKAFWPVDADVFQELQKDPVLKQRFEDAAAGVEDTSVQQELMDAEQERKEAEVAELLARRGVDGADESHAIDSVIRKKSWAAGSGMRRSIEGRRKMSEQVEEEMVGFELATIMSSDNAPGAEPGSLQR